MRILHYLSEVTLEHGGVVRSVLDFSTALTHAGHEITLACFDDTSVPAAWKAPVPGGTGLRPVLAGQTGSINASLEPGQRPGPPKTPRAITLSWPSLPKPIRRFRWPDVQTIAREIASCDVLHLHGPWESTNAQLAAIARRLKKPYVLSIHGMMDDWCMAQGALKKRFYTWWRVRRMAERAAAVLFTAEGEKRQVMKWFPGVPDERARVLPLLFDASDFTTLPGPELARAKFEALRTDGPIILFLSRLHPKKGVETLIDAAAILKREQQRFRLVIAGSGPIEYENELRRRAVDAGLSDRTYFLGMVTGREKVSLYQAADVCVLPTSQENWGFVILESLAAGTPVVTTKGVDIWPELQAGGGTIIADGTAQGIAQAVRKLLEEPEGFEAMRRSGRDWVMGWLEPLRVVGAYESLYQECVKRTRRDESLGTSGSETSNGVPTL
ncbi:MAG: glycosyltransferase [Phycisphaerales bacterium]